MPRRSAGILPYRTRDGRTEVLIGHMGGPYWSRRDEGAWSIIKGEHDEHEPPLHAARREFREETGHPPPEGEPVALGEARQRSGKVVAAWAVGGDLGELELQGNTFMTEWPPRSGRMQEFPEIDRLQWCELATARRLLVRGQIPLLERLAALLVQHEHA